MNIDTPTHARLVIHSDGPNGPGGLLGFTLRALRSIYTTANCLRSRLPLKLQIDDIQGQAVLTVAAAGPLLNVPLPAGTYHVMANLGDVRRAYTMRLEQGESLDLHLRFNRLHRHTMTAPIYPIFAVQHDADTCSHQTEHRHRSAQRLVTDFPEQERIHMNTNVLDSAKFSLTFNRSFESTAGLTIPLPSQSSAPSGASCARSS